jgi:tetratricopeptide (TPR) repeat protein
MSGSDDRGTRPPRPGAGASGPPGAIGKALGGDLEFEPDALLDSLMTEDEAPPKPKAEEKPKPEPTRTSEPPESIEPEPMDADDRETFRPSYSDDEVTIVGPRELFDPPKGEFSAPRPPSLPNLPTGPDSTARTPLLQRPIVHDPPGSRTPATSGLRAPPGVPRPFDGTPQPSTRLAPPRPAAGTPPGSDKAPTPSPGPLLPTVRPGELASLEEEEAPESQRTSLSPDEIAALEELESLGPPEPSEPPPPTRVAPRPPEVPSLKTPAHPAPAHALAASRAPAIPRPAAPAPTGAYPTPATPILAQPNPAAAPRPAAGAPSLGPSVVPQRSALASSRPPSVLPGPPSGQEGPGLPRAGQPDEWTARAEWMEAEARRIPEAAARSRALVVASELWALAGDLERARRAAQDANSAGRGALAGRQLRWLAAAAGDWKTVGSMLELELRSASTPEARAHAAYLDAEVHRLCLGDEGAASQRLELALSSEPIDPRGHVARLAQALGATGGEPDVTLPEEPGLAGLASALEEIKKLRASSGSPDGKGGAAAFAMARRALLAGDRRATAAALAEVGTVEGLAGATAWLSAALLVHDPGTRAEGAARLVALAAGPDGATARRSLAARALELGDQKLLESALDGSGDAFTPADRVALAALTGESGDTLEGRARELDGEALSPLRAAVLAGSGKDTPEAGTPTSVTEAALGRALGRTQKGAGTDTLDGPVTRFTAEHDDSVLGRALELELAVMGRASARVAEALGTWGGVGAEQPSARDRELGRALALELGEDREGARTAYRVAATADPAFEAALRAELSSLDPEQASAALAELAGACTDATHGALVLAEAAVKSGFRDAARVDEWLERAVTLDPGVSVAYRLGEEHARSLGDAERLVKWLRARREVSTDDVEKALDVVREALLTADQTPEAAAELLTSAVAAHPGDIGLRELCERMTPAVAGDERGAWREAAAQHANEPTRTLLLLQAAFEYERTQNREGAARTARLAAVSGNALAGITRARTAAGTSEAAGVAEELLARARSAADPVAERELYERLSDLDRERGDAASVVLWQAAILEHHPAWLPALRQLLRAYATGGREEELVSITAALARALPGGEGVAHARLAARFKLKVGAWDDRRELAEAAASRDPASLWALRALGAHARAADQPEKALDVYQRLFDLVEHPLDKATLALRGAEAAARLGRFEEAKTLLDACLERAPDHLVGLTTLSEVQEALRDFAAAARTAEVAAESSTVDAHRIAAFHQAAMLWLDKASDKERGRAALERVIELDHGHEDAMARLQNLLIEQGDRQALASLLERRIELAADTEERVALEVQRGKLLSGVGDTAAAKAALTAALDANPDHAGALEALAELASKEGDWAAAEQALIRLVRHAPEPARQAQIYRKLGELYDGNLPNPERAELAYQEVLKREPDDAGSVERLIRVADKLGQPARAVELAQGLLTRATNPQEKRDRTLALAVVYEQILKDKKQADSAFERARKEWPQDVAVLRALVEYHRRAGEQRAAQMLLDRAAADARRALGTGRFEPAQFEALGTVADLRGSPDAALVADATLAALAGQPFPVHGGGARAAGEELDELLAPELVSGALRALLKKTGDVLDSAYALDPRTLRAAPVPPDAGSLVELVKDLAGAFGLRNVELLMSPVLGPTCLAARAVPPLVVYGSALLEKADDATRFFLLVRAFKLMQARAATLARTVPTELGPVVAGYLSALSDYAAEGVDPKRLAEAQKRIKAAVKPPLPNDVPMLALEVVGSLGSRASQLATALNQWANRTALLAVGSPLTALRALALASNAELPPEGPERLRWIARHAEARDLMMFCVSEQYAEARARAGVAG